MPNRRQILTQNSQSRPFKVIYFDVTENPLSDYILQCNSCGIVCYTLDNIVSDRSESLHYRPPHSHLTPISMQRTHANIRTKPILLETWIPGLHFCFWQYRSIFIQVLVVGSENVCNATECMIAVQGHFRVNQGRWFWYRPKERIRFPISDQ